MKSIWIGIGFSHQSVPPLSNTATRSSAGTSSAAATKSRTACFAGPSVQLASSAMGAHATPAQTAGRRPKRVTTRQGAGHSVARTVGSVFAFAFTAALNPTLLTAVTVMLTLERPKRLLTGYLLGAALTSITCGLLLVFLLPESSTSSSAKHTVNPIIDLAFGLLILVVVFVVGTGRDRRRQAWSGRRHEKAKDKPPPRWRRTLSKGSARDTFLVGVLLSFPGASYIAGMDKLSKQDVSDAATVLSVVVFNAIMLILLEAPLLAYAIRPESTDAGVRRFSDWLSRRGGRVALIAAAVVGVLL